MSRICEAKPQGPPVRGVLRPQAQDHSSEEAAGGQGLVLQGWQCSEAPGTQQWLL